jgi:hypothetical protein
MFNPAVGPARDRTLMADLMRRDCSDFRIQAAFLSLLLVGESYNNTAVFRYLF